MEFLRLKVRKRHGTGAYENFDVPRVEWGACRITQQPVHNDKDVHENNHKLNHGHRRPTSSIGETFPHEWMLCRRLQTGLMHAWSRHMRRSRTTIVQEGGVSAPATSRAVKMICESSVVSAGLAAYVLRVSKVPWEGCYGGGGTG